MSNKAMMTIDGMPVEINGEKNLLEIIRKVGIDLPTFCYHSDLSIYGACRMCMVENDRGGLDAACSTPPKAGMNIRTNSKRLRKYRKMILELLLANHCRDCTACSKNQNCKLQDLARRFNITGVRFPNSAADPKIDDSSVCIVRDAHKCILCGDCVRMCNEIQGVGAIDFAFRGSKMTISTAFDRPIADSPCVGCGQCAAVCPTGAITVKNDVDKVWAAIDNPNKKVVVQIAPAVRVALGDALDLEEGVNSMGPIVAALHRMGFDEVYDTSTTADLTVLEETNEFVKRLNEGPHEYPLFTSCCPGWIQFCEKNYPEIMPNVSTCKSPMQMFAAIIRQQNAHSPRDCVSVAVMPCSAKKYEAAREEFVHDGRPDVDYVLTTQELIRMIKESGLVFSELQPEAVDMPFGTMSGAGVIFGVTGGVTEAVLRYATEDKSNAALMSIAYTGIRGMEGCKEAEIPFGEGSLKIAVVNGLGNTAKLIERIKAGEHYDFVEVMACPGGCIGGGGQPAGNYTAKFKRTEGIYSADKMCSIKRSEENPLMMSLYNGILKGKVHEMLHVHYPAHKGE